MEVEDEEIEGVNEMGSLKEKKVSKIESTYVKQREQTQQRQAKNKRGLLRRLVVFGICFAVLLSFTISTLFSQSSAIEKKKDEVNKIEKKLASLEKKQQLLEEEIVKLNDDEYIAKIARRDFNLSQEGEVIFNLPKSKEDKD
ncbi:FtsB family cell division protein [Bacillus massiliigorillae]|uniref:FtsB family cell division protein n=1 Tax=Bacillus massiliigorillae TaxID=1243664 RepID=UPI001E509008|nr:septum formation initiator family protein [Bacillus massiliigorillae]